MKYLCLIYENEKNYETMSPADGEAIMNEYFAFTDRRFIERRLGELRAE